MFNHINQQASSIINFVAIVLKQFLCKCRCANVTKQFWNELVNCMKLDYSVRNML